MGTVGLEDRTGRLWQARVVDIHVPSNPRGWRCPMRNRFTERLSYRHEHEFRKTVFSEFGGLHSCLVLQALP